MSGISMARGPKAVAHRCLGAPRLGSVSQIALCLTFLASMGAVELRAETISGALAKAYAFSPDLGQQRAATRAADENVPRTTSGFRPVISANGTGGISQNRTDYPLNAGAAGIGLPIKNQTYPRTAGLTVTQTIYNGDRTANTVRQAESGILQSREQLRLSELNILNAGATAYMNVLRDTALLELNNSNVQVLEEQLRQTESRFRVGDVTRTDVAQAEASLAQGHANAFTAEANLHNSLAVYRQLIGDTPKNLAPARPLDPLLPRSVDVAVEKALVEHPQIQAALHNVDAAALNVKVQEGSLYPTLSVQGSVLQSWDSQITPHLGLFQYSAIGNLTVPIYDGGQSYANIRQAKEQLGQARMQVDLQRETVRSAVVSAWGNYQATKSVIQAFQSQVRANEIALSGVRQEAKLGQRTTLDVLNAQQTLLNSRVSLVSAQRDQVVNSYNLVGAIGVLSAETLKLNVVSYDPTIHFDQVKDKIWGLRAPDGR